MKRSAPLLILVLVGGIAAGFWLRPGADAPEPEATSPVANVEATPLHQQEIAQTLRAFGVVVPAPDGALTIAAPYECVIRAIHVRVGSHVVPHDPLIEIEPSTEAALEFASAHSALALASQTLATEQERFDLNLATSQDLLTARQLERDARLRFESLQARGLDGDGRIQATTTGTVEKFDLSIGVVVPADAALLTVDDDHKLEAALSVDAAEILQLQPGQPVTLLSTLRHGSASVSSHVRQAGSAIDTTTGSVEVRVPLPNGTPLLLGEHLTAAIVVQKRSAFVVPRSAVLPDGTRWVLFTVEAGHAVRHEVVPGIIADDLVEVTGGDLKADDVVVTLGNYELTDGMSVHVGGANVPAAQEGLR